MRQSRYKQCVDTFAADIRSGRLAPGARLPTHRQLAAKEGMALVTATRVYGELAAMGLVSGETGRGTFVREPSLPSGQGIDQTAGPPGMVDLNFNYPLLPGQAEHLRAGLRRLAIAGDLEALLRYQPHAGRPHERATMAHHLALRGLDVDAQRLAIVGGAQQGLAVALMAFTRPGDLIAVDALTYPGFKVLAQAHGLELAAIPAAGQGLDVDALERLCRMRRVKAIYVMPTLHNPLGWVTSASRRRRLAALARQHGLLVIEDAAYAFLVADAPPPLARLAPERTVYVSGLSKSVATGLRVGFVVAPANWIPQLERAIRATTWNTPGVMTALACAWIDDDTVARLEHRKRQAAAARQHIVTEVFSGLACIRHPASYFAWLPLPDDLRADQVAAALLREGISVSTAEPFAASAHVPQALRLALGSVAPAALRCALKQVRRAVAG